jgi:hypothetical protein
MCMGKYAALVVCIVILGALATLNEKNPKKKALLLGNGVNLLDSNQSISWGALLLELNSKFLQGDQLNNPFKPFPLAFEEILHHKFTEGDRKSDTKNLQKAIRHNIERQLKGKAGFNEVHKKFAMLGYSDILTTNYDYGIQKSIDEGFLESKKKLAKNKQERRYSLKRRYQFEFPSLTVWHIHGELFDSRLHSVSSKSYPEESIMIGYEHYASYLERIQKNIKGESGKRKIENQSLMVRLKEGMPSPFWTDILFTHDVDIIGQGFDFSENHLWWLITHRANLMRENRLKDFVQIDNVISFFYPKITGEENIKATDDLNKVMEKRNRLMKMEAVAGLLRAFKVQDRPIECDSYEDFYTQLTTGILLKK